MSPRPRVLCAEPSADICSLLHALLDNNGLDSDAASTIDEAVEWPWPATTASTSWTTGFCCKD